MTPGPIQIPCLHVADIELPKELEKLYDLAYNLWWSWTPGARQLMAAIDNRTWAMYRSPVQLLINVESSQWEPLLDSEVFVSSYRSVIKAFEGYMKNVEESWFWKTHPDYNGGPIAYLSMEYGLHQSLALYSGGLGVLSADHLKSASDLGVPLVGVGLLYRRGYFRQTIDSDGLQQHTYPEYDFSRLPIRPAAGHTGRDVLVPIPLPGREVMAKVWVAQVGRVPLVLLDTDIPQNEPADRPITNILYVQGREMRLIQEIVLGIGAALALRELGIEPSAWHINEGHSALVQIERLRQLQGGGLSPAGAREMIHRTTVFTTHTPVPAGNEQFDSGLVRKLLDPWSGGDAAVMDTILALGNPDTHEGPGPSFNLTAVGIRTAAFVNGVSHLNARVLSSTWRHLFPGAAADDDPIRPITNGVHAPTWLGLEMLDLFDRYLGPSWRHSLVASEAWDKVFQIPDDELWAAHQAQKDRLSRFTRSRLREQLARHGRAPDELREIDRLFDTASLTIGFARRFATYKRAYLLFRDVERLEALCSASDRPLQIVFAGKAHPADRPGQELVQLIFQLSQSAPLRGRVFFLEDYDIRVARMLVQGVDVWLNTPRPPLEASGTSGQKAAMNGALNFSVLDGWWPEGYDGENGWVIGNGHHAQDDEGRDREDAASLYATLGDEIVPLYYDRDEGDLPSRWIARMKRSIGSITPRFSSDRMVREYAQTAYLPAAGHGD